jgi:DNA-binding LytR/AlgR family response regulator
MNDIIFSQTTQSSDHFADWLLTPDADAGIMRILERFGESYGADRAWLLRYNAAFTHFWNTHEWARPGVKSFVNELQGIPVEMGAFLHEKLEKGEAVHLVDVTTLPRRASAMRAEFQRQGIRSLLAVPVLWQGRLALQIGLDANTLRAHWGAREEEALREAGRLIGLRLASTTLTTPAAPQAHIHDGADTLSVAPAEILWIESAGDYSAVHFRNGRSAMGLRSLTVWEQLLSREQFIRIHRTLIVNVSQIYQLTRAGGTWKVFLHGAARLFPVGRKHRALVRHHLGF